ncbi:hypothetical protein EVG20_g7171 [Dentipellis fragilis]|uniref:Uncharacterized protein n=1 Tax=Dentipellis fragilis TaxID=205917 RepID=A0A4Y9YEZ7_9AGAM|nr:hypothetical protein EVG20_g7171 [Dentipellis fragilis]
MPSILPSIHTRRTITSSAIAGQPKRIARDSRIPRFFFTASRRKPSASKSASPHPILRVDGQSTRSTKRVRKSKRVVADLQFAAAVHRSISRRSESPDLEGRRMNVEGDVPQEHRKELDVQERLLVDRLGQHLLEQGCNPAPLDAPPLPSAPAPPAPVACAEEDINMDVTPVAPLVGRSAHSPHLSYPPAVPDAAGRDTEPRAPRLHHAAARRDAHNAPPRSSRCQVARTPATAFADVQEAERACGSRGA